MPYGMMAKHLGKFGNNTTVMATEAMQQKKEAIFTIENRCRSCANPKLEQLLSLGSTPIADQLLTQEQLSQPTITAPLCLQLCTRCSLVQIDATVAKETLFCHDYPYFSSISPTLNNHFALSAAALTERMALNNSSLVIEAGSNDGYMLRHFVQQQIPVLGIDPAEGPVNVARKHLVSSECTFFNKNLAEQLCLQGKTADLFLANNILAHVDRLNDFVSAIAIVLKDTGLAVIEIPYVVELINQGEFDTIYHQHLCYFSVTSLVKLFARHDLYINDLQQTQIHGGSLRLYIEKKPNIKQIITDMLITEDKLGIQAKHYYHDFAKRIAMLKKSMVELLWAIKKSGKKIVGYGAAAKACTFLSYMSIDKSLLDYVVDLNSFKQYKFMSGNHLPIYPPSKLLEDRPDYMLMLAWNFAKEIMSQQSEYFNQGGSFVVPIPELKIIGH